MVTLWAIVAGSPAAAWTEAGATWAEPVVPYWIARDLPFEDEDRALAAIHAAFATWAAVDCTRVRFQYVGRSLGALGATDEANVVAVVGEGWPAPGQSPSYTALVVDGTTIVEADVALDAEGATWVLLGADGVERLDLQAGVTAEVGHLLGLGDSDVPDATMNPVLLGSPAGRTLSDDDVQGVCALYPAVLPGEGEIGEPCVDDDSCDDDLRCVYDATETYCAPSCPTGSCPAGYTCLRFEGNRVCARGGCGCGSGPASGGFAALFAGFAVLSRTVIRRRAIPTLQ